jgi:hypothetical protein
LLLVLVQSLLALVKVPVLVSSTLMVVEYIKETTVPTWSTTSDRRIKKNIADNIVGLEIIRELRVRNFEYRTPEEITEVPSHAAINKPGTQIGLIAQEAQEVLPSIVKEESTGVLRVNPDNLTWYMINAVKELDAENTTLKERLEVLESKVAALDTNQ